jgi:hypothetical protein
MQLTRPGADDDELSVVVAGHGRSTSHDRGLLRVDAVALERALGRGAREARPPDQPRHTRRKRMKIDVTWSAMYREAGR